MTGTLIKKGNLDTDVHIQGKQCEVTRGEDGHLQTQGHLGAHCSPTAS